MNLIEFVQQHQVALSILITALIDFLIEVNPRLSQNSLVSLILSVVKKKSE